MHRKHETDTTRVVSVIGSMRQTQLCPICVRTDTTLSDLCPNYVQSQKNEVRDVRSQNKVKPPQKKQWKLWSYSRVARRLRG